MMNCYDLKMSLFISYLLNETDRPDNWQDLYSEYIGLRENKSSLFILKLMTEIKYLQTKYLIIEKVCGTLIQIGRLENAELVDLKGLTDILKEYGYRGQYDIKNKSTFTRDIKTVLSGSKNLITQWQRKEQELDVYEKKHAGKEIQKKDFYVWAVTLTKYLGDYVDLDKVTVAMWCEMINHYEKYCEVVNAEANNQLKK